MEEEEAPTRVERSREAVSDVLERIVAELPGGGEARVGQREMAQAVATAITERRHLVVQAGTGTGKSLAYLVPAILSGQRVMIATATKALQDQLATKDLPFLQAHLGLPFEFATLKGRANYLCVQRAREVAGGGGDENQLTLDDATPSQVGELGKEILALIEWGKTTETGDRSDLSFEPRPRAWSQVSVNAMECPGAAKCPSGDDCFAEAARQRAELADVIVVNTHLYGTHLATGGYVLPEHDVVIFDEAHELEDVAAASLGLELGAGRFRALARNAQGLIKDRSRADVVAEGGEVIESALMAWHGQRFKPGLDESLKNILISVGQRVSELTSAVRAGDGDGARKARVLQASGHIQGDIAFLLEAGPGDVLWVEGPVHAPVLRVAPIDVAAKLREKLWDNVTAVLTSATIPNNLATRVGLPPDGHDVLDVGSPFDYESNALLYCPMHLPDPRHADYEVAMHDELAALITAAGGRTLALFTSWRAMEAAAKAMTARLDVPILTQTDLPKPALVKAFTDDESACLFATMGFWQGVDVPGRSLSLVVLDRIPFPRPDEPLMQARRDQAGAAAFRVVDLPRAATLLAQGSGRLIRNTTDTGVVAILDPRLGKAGYKWDLVRALPPMHRTREREEAERFLRRLADAAEEGQ
ncbi:MAG: ATP-dependent helicase DinG [Actinomycetota bacterium]|nr:ATP-dependent helicase DinG [Actinomycetota bacterium]